MARRKTVVIGILGTTLDGVAYKTRWERWRPTVSLAQQDDLIVDRLELLRGPASGELAATVIADIAQVSPDTKVVEHIIEFGDPWDFEGVYQALFSFAASYPFDDREDYLVHITTGTHVAQICLFLLTEARYLPARLIQTSPGKHGQKRSATGTHGIIDLDLGKYDAIASRVRQERATAQSRLKGGIETKNAAFNALIERVEHVSTASRAPILLCGPTGAGKTQLARRIFELKKEKRQVVGEFAEINCATLRGDAAMSALFGHVRGAFTGAVEARSGLLKRAHRGVLFLDEIAELGLDEQAMLLRAIEEKVFYPMGSDKEATSDFQLIAGTHRDLHATRGSGRFREDLLARIDLWTFRLPALNERPEDIAPNLDFELHAASRTLGVNVTMSRDARGRFVSFAESFAWPGNFRAFAGSVTRMATIAQGGRITPTVVAAEIDHLRTRASSPDAPIGNAAAEEERLLAEVLGAKAAGELDRFDRVQLVDVLRVCRSARSLAEAGRVLFAASRQTKASANDSDRLRKYLARFGVDFASLPRRATAADGG